MILLIKLGSTFYFYFELFSNNYIIINDPLHNIMSRIFIALVQDICLDEDIQFPIVFDFYSL